MASQSTTAKKSQGNQPPVMNGKNDDANKGTSTSTHHQVRAFLTSSVTIAITLVRIGCLLPKELWPLPLSSSSSVIGWFLHNSDLAPFWTSTLIRPHETWDHIREAQAVRALWGNQFRDAYRGSYIHLPPLVLAALEAILDLLVVVVVPVPTIPWQSLLLGIFAHGVDLTIAVKLIQLGRHVLEDLRDPWEDELQPRIPKSLRPPLTHIFAVSPSAMNYTNELPDMRVVTSSENGKSQETNSNAQVADSNDTPSTSPGEESNQHEDEDESWSPVLAWSDMPFLAAQLYYYSPWTALASGLGSTHQSFQNLWLFLLLQSLEEGCRHPSSPPLAAVWLTLASYMEPHYVVFLIPLSLWVQRRAVDSSTPSSSRRISSKVYTLWFSFAFWFACLQGLSLMLVGRSQFGAVLYSSFGHVYTWKHVHPNFSVLWYLNMELFERYRIYFAVLIGGLPYLLVAPISIRLHRYPMVLVAIFWMLWTMIRPTSTLVDANIAGCFALLCPRSLSRMRIATSLIPAFAITVPISLYLVTLWLWLETGSGEANFTFFQCLAYCGFLATFFLEFCGGSMRRDKVLRLTEKLCREEMAKKESCGNEGLPER